MCIYMVNTDWGSILGEESFLYSTIGKALMLVVKDLDFRTSLAV